MSTFGAWLFLSASILHIRMFLQLCLHPFEGIFPVLCQVQNVPVA